MMFSISGLKDLLKGFSCGFIIVLLLIPALSYAQASSSEEINAVGNSRYPPFLFVNDSAKPDGFVYQIFKLIEKESGLRFNFHQMEWNRVTQNLYEGKADIILGINKSEEREKYYDFSEPITENKIVIFVKTDDYYITRLEDLSGRNIGVQKGDLADEYLYGHPIAAQVTKFPDHLTALEELRKGKLDAVLGSYFVGLYWTHKYNYKDKIKVAGTPLLTVPYCIGVKDNSNHLLLSKINKAIIDLKKKGTLTELQNQWFGDATRRTREEENLILKILLYAGMAGTIVLVLSWVVVYLLRKKIARSTSELKEVNRYNKSLIENASDVIIVLKDNGIMSYISPSFGKIIGYSTDELKNKPFFDYIHNEDIPLATSLLTYKWSPVSNLNHLRFVAMDNAIRILEVLVNDQREDHAIGGIIINGRDITERVNAEKEIRMLALTIKNISECVNITDIKNNILFVNDAFLRTYGYERDEVIGKNITMVRAKSKPREGLEEMYFNTLKKGNWQGELFNKRKNGEEFPVFLSTAVIYDNREIPVGLVGVSTDITERKAVEQELIRAKEKAERSDRLKSEFLAQMSHEIRTPINTILSFTSLLKEEFQHQVGEDLRSSFNIIDNGGRRLIRTIDMILNMSEIQAGNFEISLKEIDIIADVLSGLINEFLNPARTKKLSLRLENRANGTKVFGDSYTITQVFQNLIDNAIKYTSEGSVDVLVYKNERHNLCVEVSDTGIGIAENYLPRLFEPFSQEESGYTRRFEGNGLGLSLVKKYVELNNAEIKVISKKGKGSRFIVSFKI